MTSGQSFWVCEVKSRLRCFKTLIHSHSYNGYLKSFSVSLSSTTHRAQETAVKTVKLGNAD